MSELSDKIILLKEMGYSYKKIKTELGCSLGTISYYLGEGQKEKNLIRQRSRASKKRKLIQQVKQDAICVDCGEDYPYWIMEFDHLGDKSFNIGSTKELGDKTYEQLIAEIAKCDIVCSNCHKNRTYLRRTAHGADALDLTEFYN